MVNVVPVDRVRHAAKGWCPAQGYAFAATHAAVPLVAPELAAAAVTMPIAFAEQSGRYAPVGVMSPLQGRNLFVAPNGQWLASYVPAALRSYPFGLVRAQGSDKLTFCIDEDSDWVVDVSAMDAAKFFEEDGSLSAATKAKLEFLQQVERGRAATELMVAALAEAGLIQPWPLAVHDGKQQVPVNGLHRINEPALLALDDAGFLKLRKTSALALAYAQLISMQTVGVFGSLLAIQQQLAKSRLPEASALFQTDDSGAIRFN